MCWCRHRLVLTMSKQEIKQPVFQTITKERLIPRKCQNLGRVQDIFEECQDDCLSGLCAFQHALEWKLNELYPIVFG